MVGIQIAGTTVLNLFAAATLEELNGFCNNIAGFYNKNLDSSGFQKAGHKSPVRPGLQLRELPVPRTLLSESLSSCWLQQLRLLA